MSRGDTLYKIRSLDLGDVIVECNRIFELLADRLDRIEGLRGSPRLYDKQQTDFDTIYSGINSGPVVRDQGNPPRYWRIGVDTAGE